MPRVPAPRIALLAAAAALALSACTGGAAEPAPSGPPAPTDGLPVGNPTDLDDAVAFTPCGTGLPCTGTVGGTRYEIRLPEQWNGTLLLHAHGLRAADPLEPGGSVPDVVPEVAPGVAGGVTTVADALLDQGYALAGVAAPEPGWSVEPTVEALGALRAAFVGQVGVPNRIHVWGDSIGAVVAVRAQQAQPWVNGALGMCGVHGGLNANFDLALDVAVGVKALLAPKLQLTGYADLAAAQREYRRGLRAIQQAAEDPTGVGLVALQTIAATTELPTQTRTSSGVGSAELAGALVENVGRVLVRTTLDRFRVEQAYGGNPSTNLGVNYGARVTADEAAAIDATAGAEGATLALVRRIASLPAVQADPPAREAADEAFPKPEALTRPLLTLHTAADPVAILANESLLAGWVGQADAASLRWLNVNVSSPPATYPESGVAPAGAGHCAFTSQSVLGAVQVLDDWVGQGRFPTWAGNAEAFGPDSGFSGPPALPPWPQSPTTPGS
jgi:hypothetical protein